jgi:hypothetical protein
MRVIAFAAIVPLLMRFPIERVGRWLEPARTPPTEPPLQAVHALVADIDGWLGRVTPPLRPTCVTRGLTRYRFLRRAGAKVALRFGIGPVNGNMEAHCWITYAGEPLGERDDPRGVFTEMWVITA